MFLVSYSESEPLSHILMRFLDQHLPHLSHLPGHLSQVKSVKSLSPPLCSTAFITSLRSPCLSFSALLHLIFLFSSPLPSLFSCPHSLGLISPSSLQRFLSFYHSICSPPPSFPPHSSFPLPASLSPPPCLVVSSS